MRSVWWYYRPVLSGYVWNGQMHHNIIKHRQTRFRPVGTIGGIDKKYASHKCKLASGLKHIYQLHNQLHTCWHLHTPTCHFCIKNNYTTVHQNGRNSFNKVNPCGRQFWYMIQLHRFQNDELINRQMIKYGNNFLSLPKHLKNWIKKIMISVKTSDI